MVVAAACIERNGRATRSPRSAIGFLRPIGVHWRPGVRRMAAIPVMGVLVVVVVVVPVIGVVIVIGGVGVSGGAELVWLGHGSAFCGTIGNPEPT